MKQSSSNPRPRRGLHRRSRRRRHSCYSGQTKYRGVTEHGDTGPKPGKPEQVLEQTMTAKQYCSPSN